MHSHARVLSIVLVALALAACGKKDGAGLLAPADPSRSQPGYVSPPHVLSVSGQPGGAIEIQGLASPEARIRGELDRKGYGATAGKDGRFTLELPPISAPELVIISQEDGRRQLQTDGWLFVPPDAPSRAVVLRPGAPSRPLQSDLVATIDFDAGGNGAISGVTTPGASVDVSVDGGAVMHATADRSGVWDARLGVTSGSHQIRVASRGRVVDRAFDFTPGVTGEHQLFNPVREADGWRIAWSTNGTGVQTTLVLTGAERS